MHIFQNAVVRNRQGPKKHFVKDEEPYKVSFRTARAVTQRNTRKPEKQKPNQPNKKPKGEKEKKKDEEPPMLLLHNSCFQL